MSSSTSEETIEIAETAQEEQAVLKESWVKLTITVEEAKYLQRKTHGRALSKEDPFCCISVGKQSVKTRTRFNTLNPKWNETFVFGNVTTADTLQLVLKDKKLFAKEEYIFGQAEVPLQDIPLCPKVEELPLVPEGSGVLVVQYFTTPIPSPYGELQPPMKVRGQKKDITHDCPSLFSQLFKLPKTEYILKEHSASLVLQVVYPGKVFLSPNYICFYSNFMGIQITESIPIEDIIWISKQNRSIPNAGITIGTVVKEYQFAKVGEQFVQDVENLWKSGFVDNIQLDSENVFQDELSEAIVGDSENIQVQVASSYFPVPPTELFTLFFSNSSPFLKTFYEKMNLRDLNFGRWAPFPQKGYFRMITYSYDLHNEIGDSSRVEETQLSHWEGTDLVIQTAKMLLDVPFGDNFRLESHLRLKATQKGSQMIIHLGVNFTKNEPGMDKESISRVILEACRPHYEELERAVSAYFSSDPPPLLQGYKGFPSRFIPKWEYSQRVLLFSAVAIFILLMYVWILYRRMAELEHLAAQSILK